MKKIVLFATAALLLLVGTAMAESIASKDGVQELAPAGRNQRL